MARTLPHRHYERGVVGLVQLLTARSDLLSERDAILSNHRLVAAEAVLAKEPK